MRQEGNVIYADFGKVFKRKNHSDIYGDTIYLGYSYYIDGQKLDVPHQDTAEDFEEIDSPSDTDAQELLNIITGKD